MALSCRVAAGLPATPAIGRAAVRGAVRGRASRHARHASLSTVRMAVDTAAPPRSALDMPTAEHPAFELLRVETVDEYTLKCATYRHRKSGAEVISAAADDDNKVFGIVFRTPVTDSTGVPHILEHSVLCGSDKYTSKEPFAELLKGSLQTFLNAFTYPDRTCYPVASQNTKDFYNLVNVYLDAVLNPRAKRDPTVLQQEGWHYELDDAAAPLSYKGVVFNEMKGVYSSPDSRMYRAAQQATFPDTTYAVDSGGDPAVIPSLTFEQFKSFHDAYYHPANSRIFFYGDDDLSYRLQLLDDYLSAFDAPPTPPTSAIATQKLYTQPWKVVEPFPASAEAEAAGGQHMVMLNWLLNEEPLGDVDELALNILDHLLMGTTTAPLYKAMLDSGLGAALMGGGLSDELKQATFSVGLKGVAKADVREVEALALRTLAETAAQGFDADAIEASLNTIEFSMREMNTGGFPKGLAFMLSIMPRWIYREGESPTDALRFEAPLSELKRRLAAGEKVFEGLLTKLLLDNGHRTTVELAPDETLAAKLQTEEERVLAEAKEKMSDAELQEVISSTAALKAAQLKEDSAADLATIPRVGLADLEREVKTIRTETAALPGGGTLLTNPMPTAGVVYADVLLDLSVLPLSELPLMGLFTRLLLETGTSEMEAVTLQRRIGARTGGIDASIFSQQRLAADGAVADPYDVVHMLAVRAKGTSEKAEQLFDLVGAVLTDANLDSKAKVVEILKESKANLESRFVSSGNAFASLRLSSRTSLLGYISEQTGGVSYYATVKAMLENAQSDWPSLLARLVAVRDAVLSQKGVVINLTADPAALDAARPAVDAFVGRLPAASAAAPAAPWREEVSLAPKLDEAYAITTQVNYVAAGARLFEPGTVHNMGAYGVVARYLSSGYLWDNVRVVGGAYGGGCALNPNSGAFAFSSYRDPNLQDTLDIYAATPKVLAELELTDEALEQAIVGAVGELDKPLTPDQKGLRALTWHLLGQTTEGRQRYRDEMLGTTREDFRKFGEVLSAAQLKVAIFGSAEALEKANAARPADEQIAVTKLA
uniref:Peptidase M16C associated domain-containing protein n=1 Tax=Calcidiscus leptoporus TaxID=127549 RepID=A0A6U5MC85_9EUKA